jgi:DNA polymerase-3 subunit delta
VALKPAYVIAGSDWSRVDTALRRLRGRFPDTAVEQLSVSADPPPDVVAACNALDLFGGDRLVVLRGADDLSDDALREIGAYLRDPAPATVLALVAGAGITPKHRLARAVDGVGELLLYDAPEPRQAEGWVIRRFEREGVRCPRPVARRLVELVGDDVADLGIEIEKVATYCRGEPPEIEDVERLVIANPESRMYRITDAWARRDVAATLALAAAEVDGPGDVSRLVSYLASHIRRVRSALLVLEAGGTADDVKRRLELRYSPSKLIAQARRFTEPELADAIVRLARLDLAVKGESRLDPRIELELALADVTAG